jgi:hypothetical protein
MDESNTTNAKHPETVGIGFVSLEAVVRWYEDSQGALEADKREVIAFAGLVVLERMRNAYPVTRDLYWSNGNRGRWTAKLVQDILIRYGETRRVLSEAGRTTGSSPNIAHALALSLNNLEPLLSLSTDERNEIIDDLQEWLVARVTLIFDQRQRLLLTVDPNLATTALVASILEQAGRRRGAVAQHLIGAKLSLRFQDSAIQIENHSYTAGDVQTDRPGDFVAGRIVYHSTISPSRPLLEKCHENLRQGLRPYILTMSDKLSAAEEFARQEGIPGRVSVEAISSFVGQNIDEIATAREASVLQTIHELLTIYNRRATEVESDISVLLDIPGFLSKPESPG